MPSGSLEDVPSKSAVRSVAEEVKAAVGNAFGSVTVMSFDVSVSPPALSVTLSTTVYVPSAA